ncbi:DNA ligase [Pontiella desulfatans]|uniref:DNA ligase (NAD(+)) n=1 Tax=Pontiella desulfatans TaxID=2750659 RepID=A0A6C2TWR9_PONDE|nr:hypothetical protein [Pontiella desulfatans]VGO12135.1 DNA ligase [Pontiella desulfatans]
MKPLSLHLNKLLLMGGLLLLPLPGLAVPAEIARQAECLRAILAQADDAYYNKHESIMGNEAYDALRRRHEELVQHYPELSVNTVVGAVDEGNGIPHAQPVLSLKKAYSDEDVEKFIAACGTNQTYCIEPKIDGLTVVLQYESGVLVRALTRGDGATGQDITKAVLAAGCVPPALTGAAANLSVRGELFLGKKAFSALNARRKEKGMPVLKSARNSASGTVRLTDYAEISRRGLDARVFEWIDGDLQPESHAESLALLWELGLPTIQSLQVPSDRVVGEIARLNGRLGGLPFETDGIVIKVDNRNRFTELGATAHHPRGALARKYKGHPVVTQLLRVEWSQGSTGKWTPVAHFAPIEMAGATVRSATLHNADHLRALDLRIGDWIQVIRAGGAVPEIVGVCTERRTGNETPVEDYPDSETDE